MSIWFNIIETIAAVLGLYLYKYLQPTAIRYLVWLMVYTCINEWIVKKIFFPAHNFTTIDLFYNLFSFAECGLYYLFIINIPIFKKITLVVKLLFITTIAAYLADIIFNTGIYSLHINSIKLFNICVIGSCIHYFIHILKAEYHPLSTDVLFFIFLSFFVYHSFLFFRFNIIESFSFFSTEIGKKIYQICMFIGDSVMYLGFSYSCYLSYQLHKKNVDV